MLIVEQTSGLTSGHSVENNRIVSEAGACVTQSAETQKLALVLLLAVEFLFCMPLSSHLAKGLVVRLIHLPATGGYLHIL